MARSASWLSSAA
ncbi:hypothetical protein D041_4144A, partial [Vibrio parahaemolyticus EKP-008]